MPTYKRTAVTAKEGINFIRSAVESAGSLFVKIEHENDIGIDALIEFIADERPLNKQIAVQIKSGASYYVQETGECVFPVGDHRDYWVNHPLPVVGLVYVPALESAFWASIKGLLKANPETTTMRFSATEANRFDARTFSTIFVPQVVGSIPDLEFDEALRLARSEKPDETYLGLMVLFRRYQDNTAVWDELVHVFLSRAADEIPPVLVYWLAHIPGHGDIFYFGKMASHQARAYARTLFGKFEVDHVLKLLSFIDPEAQIARGTLGQSVEAIISSLPRSSELLREIVWSPKNELRTREFAALILAMNERDGAIPDLRSLEAGGSWHASEIRKHIETWGSINPY
jgi:hypothetical protein